jgi:hypothetical protein
LKDKKQVPLSELRVRVRVRARARARARGEQIESSNRINHGGTREISLATDKNVHRQVAMVFRECYWLELIWIGCFSAVLVLSETVLVLVIESSLERSYTRSSHDLPFKETKQVSLSDHEDEHEHIASCTRNARPVSAKAYRLGFARFPKDFGRLAPERLGLDRGLIFRTLPLIERRRLGLASVSVRCPLGSFGLERGPLRFEPFLVGLVRP